jgi:hypothetical protein
MPKQGSEARLSRLVFGIWAAAMLIHNVAFAQSTVDVSACFGQMLQNKFDFAQRDSLLLSALSRLSVTDIKTAQDNLSLAGAVPGLFVQGDDAKTEQNIHALFKENQLHENHYSETLMSSVWLNDKGYDVIEHCIDAVASGGDGLRYIYKVTKDRKLVLFQLFWSSKTGGPSSLNIIDSQLIGAHVDSNTVPAGKLFKPTTKLESDGKASSRPSVLGAAGTPIVLVPDKKDDEIIIILTTDQTHQPKWITIPNAAEPPPVYWAVTDTDKEISGSLRDLVFSREIRGRVIRIGGVDYNDRYDFDITMDPGYQVWGHPTCVYYTDPNKPPDSSNIH